MGISDIHADCYAQPRAGDIAAFHDTRFKGRKGISSYEQHVGSVEEPLVGIIAEFDTKGKHKLRVLQVERGVSGSFLFPNNQSRRLIGDNRYRKRSVIGVTT
jgi:hypothetical protein